MYTCILIAVMFTFSFGSAFAADSFVAPGDADKVVFADVVKELTDVANALKADELAVKNAALKEIFNNGTTATLDGVKVTKEAVEKVYNEKVYDLKITAIDNELATLVQKAQSSMNIVKDATLTNLLNGQFNTAGYNATTTSIEYSGFFNASNTNAYDFDAVLNIVYVYPEQVKTLTTTANTTAEYKAVFEGKGESTAPTGSDINLVGKTAYTAVKDAAVTAINAIDLSAYSKDYKGSAKSNYELAAEAVNQALEAINAAPTATWDGYKAQIGVIDAMYTAPVNQQAATGTLMSTLTNIPKVADEPTEAAKLSFAKSYVLSDLTSKINNYYDGLIKAADNNILTEQLKGTSASADKIAKYQEAKDDAVKAKANALEIATYLVNAKTAYAELITGYGNPFNAASATSLNWNFATGTLTIMNNAAVSAQASFNEATMTDIVKKVAALKEEAALLKASIEIDGTTAAEIDAELEAAIEDAYNGNLNAALDGNGANQILLNRIDALIGTGNVKVNDRSYNGVGAWATGSPTFEADMTDEVRAAISEAKAAIKAATSIADADAAFLAAYEKYEAIPTSADKTKARNTKEFKDLLAQYEAEIEAYVAYKVAGLEATGADDDYTWTPGTNKTTAGMKKNLVDTFADAYTVDELKAAYTAAKAEVDNLKTTAQLKEAKAALDTRSNALPATVTLADKEAVKALKADIKAHNDYCDLIGNTAQKVIVTAAVDNAAKYIQNIEDKAITDAYDAIMKDNKVTTDEKAAVEALRAAYDQYVKDYTAKDAATLTVPTLGDTKMDNAEKALAAAEVTAVAEMIAKLPADGSDIEGVKAARAAYDALTLEQKVKLDGKYYDKLVDLEKLIDIATGVETLKITAGSTAKKGSITVKWTVKGTGDRDGFQIWKSTKKNKGFKKAFTTTKTTYKNTKGLKKGTRYYYKVRAYQVVDGKNVYSDWSNKAIRIAK